MGTVERAVVEDTIRVEEREERCAEHNSSLIITSTTRPSEGLEINERRGGTIIVTKNRSMLLGTKTCSPNRDGLEALGQPANQQSVRQSNHLPVPTELERQVTRKPPGSCSKTVLLSTISASRRWSEHASGGLAMRSRKLGGSQVCGDHDQVHVCRGHGCVASQTAVVQGVRPSQLPRVRRRSSTGPITATEARPLAGNARCGQAAGLYAATIYSCRPEGNSAENIFDVVVFVPLPGNLLGAKQVRCSVDYLGEGFR
ncbi:hypothetical protein QBC35DRAFT_549813 [Podospora australis]|uniref:Uncharacterized protein n=1 Tax=Podospora australis TaxID=1536484 RepID=A0AAN7AJY7_9PEZI|nr:hypothetical protein QBC35DRAFT_549813 [Podospora australis]